MLWMKKHWILIALIIGIGIYVLQDSLLTQPAAENEIEIVLPEDSSNLPADSGQNLNETESETIQAYVDMKGEVNRPGVYQIPNEDTRVRDVIELAGGFTEDAASDAINLAQRVVDEMVIIVPKQGGETAVISLPQSNKVKMNVASADEIASLNGIGEVKATAIIAYREENGPFQSVEDLLQVAGIGEKTLEKIQNDIVVP